MEGIADPPTLDAFDEVEYIIQCTENHLVQVDINRLQSQYLVEKFRQVRGKVWIWRHYMLGLVFVDEADGERFRRDFEQRTAGALRELCWVLKDGEELLGRCSGDWLQKAMKRADCRDAFQVIVKDLAWCMQMVHDEMVEGLRSAGLYNVRFDAYRWDDVLEASLQSFWEAADTDVGELLERMDKLLEEHHLRDQMKAVEDYNFASDDDTFESVSATDSQNCLIALHLTRRLREFDRPLRQDSHKRNSSANADINGGDTLYTPLPNQNGAESAHNGQTEENLSVKSGMIRVQSLPEYFRVDAGQLSKIRRHIGHGASGTVFEISWLRERYAVKTFSSTDYSTFTKEAAILAHLKHPNIVQLICCSKSATGECSLVMDVMQKNLTELIRSCVRRRGDGSIRAPPFSLQVSVDIMLQIARSMEYLHAKDVMHRDLKSLNILVESSSATDTNMDGRVRVKTADFGFSKIKTDSSSYSSVNVGTPYWRAPEVFQVLGSKEEHPHYKKSADVYSFAITCYEILTGVIPFSKLSEWQLYQKLSRGERPELPDRIPIYLASCMQRWWAADADSRPPFPEIRKMLEHLKRILVRVRPEQVYAIMNGRPVGERLCLFSFFSLKDVQGLIDVMGEEWCAQHAVGPNAIQESLFLTALLKVKSG